jgi:hypothetical protein
MKAETKQYSDFIKRNKIVVRKDCFICTIRGKPTTIPISKYNDGKWYAERWRGHGTKKAAIYWWLINYTKLE